MLILLNVATTVNLWLSCASKDFAIILLNFDVCDDLNQHRGNANSCLKF